MAVTGYPTPDILARHNFVNVEKKALTDASANLASALTPGQIYEIVGDAPWHVNIGDSAGAVTATTSHLLLAANQAIVVYAKDGHDKVAGICDTGLTANIYVIRRV